MPSLRVFLAIAAVAATLVAPAAADDAPPPAEPGVLRVAMSGSYPPLHEDAEGGGRAGLEVDLAHDLARALGLRARFVGRDETGVGAVEAVASGKADVAISAVTPTEERRRLVDFTRPYVTLRYRLAGTAADVEPGGGVITRGKRVAVPKGPAVQAARAVLKGAKLVEAASTSKALELVARGKAHLAFAEDVGLLLALAGTDLAIFGPPLGASPLAIAVPRGQAARYDEALSRLSDRIAELVQQYEPGAVPEEPRIVHLGFEGAEATFRLDLESGTLEESPVPEGEEWHDAAAGIELTASPSDAGEGLPKALRRRAGRELADAASAAWVQLSDGTVLAFEKWRVEDECGGEETGPDGQMVEYRYECGEEGYTVVVFRAGGVQSARVTTLVEGT